MTFVEQHPDTKPLTLEEAQDIVAAAAVQRDYYCNEYRPMEAAYLPDLCAWFDGRAPGLVVEVGPGHGTMIPWWASRGWRVVVMDLMPLGHWITSEFLAEWDAQYVQRDIFDGPLDVEADVVVMMQVLPHLRWRPDLALIHCARMCLPTGVVITSALDARFYPQLTGCYNSWREMPIYGEGIERPDMVQCMFTEETYRDLLGTVFGDVQISMAQSAAVMLAEARLPLEAERVGM